jgi:serine/threonine protein kinase
MPLAPGTRLGPYQIEAAIGAGGMGEVYRARDTRLDRTVAIKVVPDGAATHLEYRQRLQRQRALLKTARLCFAVKKLPSPSSQSRPGDSPERSAGPCGRDQGLPVLKAVFRHARTLSIR